MLDTRELVVDPTGTAATFPGVVDIIHEFLQVKTDAIPWDPPSGAAAWLESASAAELAGTVEKSSRFIAGHLPEHYRLVFPIPVEVWNESSEVVVAQPELRLHSFGPDIPAAMSSFREVLVEHFERLQRYADRLSPAMEEDLRLLRALLRRDG